MTRYRIVRETRGKSVTYRVECTVVGLFWHSLESRLQSKASAEGWVQWYQDQSSTAQREIVAEYPKVEANEE